MTRLTDIAIGIDIGGTNTAIGIIDRDGNSMFETSISTTSFPTPEALVAEIYHVINQQLMQWENGYALRGIGVGAPNGNYYSGTVEYAPNLHWKGVVNLHKLFGQHFSVPCFVTNDANAATIGEMLYGNAKGMKNFVMITLGTGLGSGFVSNGTLIYGDDGFAGELGHVVINPDGRDCGCGRKGCLETYVSATGIVRTAHIMLAKHTQPSILRQLSGEELTGKAITEAAREGDPLALEIFDYTARKLGFAIANTVAITSPEAIILFGGLALAGDLIIKPTHKYMEQNMLNIFKNKVQLLGSGIQDRNAGVLGAGALVWQELEKKVHHEIKLN